MEGDILIIHIFLHVCSIMYTDVKDAAFQIQVLDLRYDWMRRLEHIFSVDQFDYLTLASRLLEFQYKKNLPPTAIPDASTRLALVRDYPELAITMVGRYLEPRRIIQTTRSAESQYEVLSGILRTLGHRIVRKESVPQIVGIRGVAQMDDGWYQTGSAKQFAASEYGHRLHFCSDKPDYADALMAVMWLENCEYHVEIYPGVVNPNGIWPEGTAHLCSGQYRFRLGRHRTFDPDHIAAVQQLRQNWPSEWVYDETANSIQYIALEGCSPIEVVRSHADSLDISPQDIEAAEIAIAHRDPRFVDEHKIKINIHTCAFGHASSLGCQNVLPQYYTDFIQTLVRLADRQRESIGYALDLMYSLIDASSIGEL